MVGRTAGGDSGGSEGGLMLGLCRPACSVVLVDRHALLKANGNGCDGCVVVSPPVCVCVCVCVCA